MALTLHLVNLNKRFSRMDRVGSAQKRCESCTLCCSVYEVADFEKKAHHPCSQLSKNPSPLGGCGRHGLHPRACQKFECLWLKMPELDPRWRPNVAGFILRLGEDGVTVCIDEDAARPAAWRREPYYKQIKTWSESLRRGEGRVMVYAPEGLWLITPEEDLPLRTPPKGATIESGYEPSLFGLRPYARVVQKPRRTRKAA